MVCVFYGPSIPLLMRASIVENKDLVVLVSLELKSDGGH